MKGKHIETQRSQDRKTNNKLLLFLKNKALIIMAMSLGIILYLTLLPFNFAIPYNLSINYIVEIFQQATNINDIIVNIILFMPFGLSLTAFFASKSHFFIKILVTVFFLTCCLSLTVEILQIFLISRHSTLSDIVCNSLGGLLGGCCFVFLKRLDRQAYLELPFLAILKQPGTRLKGLSILWLSYFLLLSFLIIGVRESNKLNNWSTHFHLMVGNEALGDRPWQGEISSFCIAKDALAPRQVWAILKSNNFCEVLARQSHSSIAAYVFNKASNSYVDLSSNSANLDSQATEIKVTKNKSIIIDRKNWLKTRFPVTKLNTEISQSSQFTILTQIATSSLQQEGPARIITVSYNHLWRNFTVAQWRNALIFRLRTPLTDTNGKKPEFRLNNVFNNTESQKIAISYDGVNLRFYRENNNEFKSLYLGLEATLFWTIFSPIAQRMSLNVDNNWLYTLVYYGFIFAPLGILWSMIWKLIHFNRQGLSLFIITGLFLPSLIIEAMIAGLSDRPWNWQYFSLGLVILFVSFVGARFVSKKSIF